MHVGRTEGKSFSEFEDKSVDYHTVPNDHCVLSINRGDLDTTTLRFTATQPEESLDKSLLVSSDIVNATRNPLISEQLQRSGAYVERSDLRRASARASPRLPVSTLSTDSSATFLLTTRLAERPRSSRSETFRRRLGLLFAQRNATR